MVTVHNFFKSSCWQAVYFQGFCRDSSAQAQCPAACFLYWLLITVENSIPRLTLEVVGLCLPVILVLGLFFLIGKACWEWYSADEQGETGTESNTGISSYVNSTPFPGKNLEWKIKSAGSSAVLWFLFCCVLTSFNSTIFFKLFET